MPRNISPFLGYTVKLICRDCGQDFIGGDGMVRCKRCAAPTEADRRRVKRAWARIEKARQKERIGSGA